MNQIAPIVSARFVAVQRQERDAFVSLALSQRRLSWRYRTWAGEDEARGDLAAYHRHTAEAKRLWRDALFHLDFARSRSHGA